MMSPLVYKLTLSPLLVGLASLIGRRWGGVAAGLVVAGLPIVAAPVVLFYALEQGPAFAGGASVATLLGMLSLCAFLLTYAWRSWSGGTALSSLVLGWAAFALVTLLIDRVLDQHAATLPKSLAYALAALYLARRSLPPVPDEDDEPVLVRGSARPLGAASAAPGSTTSPWDGFSERPFAGADAAPAGPWVWDLPLRMAAAALLVLALTNMAPRLGPILGGLLTPFPVASTVMAVFAHLQEGRAAVRSVIKGILMALNAYAVFFAVLALLLPGGNLALSFAAATLAAGLIQGALILYTLRDSAPSAAQAG